MARHRKGRQAHRTSLSARHPKSANNNHWFWLMIGLLMGILGITAIFLFVTGKWPVDTFNPSQFMRQSNATNAIVADSATKKKLPKRKQAQKPPIKTPTSKNTTAKKQPARFEFYQLLPGMEVPLPDTTNEGKK